MRYQMGSGECESGCMVLLKEQLDWRGQLLDCVLYFLFVITTMVLW